MIIAVIICRLLCFSCKLIAFHADLCLLSMQACQMTATVGRHIIEGGSLYSPTCIETVVKPPSYLAVLKTAVTLPAVWLGFGVGTLAGGASS